jgi:hypothetical protein
MIKRVWELFSTDCRMILWMMEEVIKVNRETICGTLVENLWKRKVCTRFVLHCLTDEQKDLRLQYY